MKDIMQGALNAVTNSSDRPVTAAEIVEMLKNGDGEGHLVRALFGDCGIDVLARLGDAGGMSLADLRTSYRRARDRHGARNADFETADP